MIIRIAYILAILISLATSSHADPSPTGKAVAGYVERIALFPGELLVHAKLDTGAKNSSLNAQDQERFRRDGEQWIRFTITSQEGHTATFERPLQKTVKIKRHFGESQERPVITLGVCLGKASPAPLISNMRSPLFAAAQSRSPPAGRRPGRTGH